MPKWISLGQFPDVEMSLTVPTFILMSPLLEPNGDVLLRAQQ